MLALVEDFDMTSKSRIFSTGGRRRDVMMVSNGNFWNTKELYLLQNMNHFQMM